ncbi:MAG: hypothetical protein DHS20C14_05220 [Phycisphaeraceae bacterium]|nr:MAG: hypothetical protein DHS20C14_05220 [Phycisphaeraceae bacterium]
MFPRLFMSLRLASLTAAIACAPATAAPHPEWTLFSTRTTTTTTLIDLEGGAVKTWPSAYLPGMTVYLLDDGAILRAAADPSLPGPNGGGAGGRLQIIAWDGTLEWDFPLAGVDHRQHHDALMLPNGNVLAIVWESYSAADAIAMGRDPDALGSEVWSEAILEIQPTGPTTGVVVWEWHAWDALVQDFDPLLPNYAPPADNPSRIDINYIPNGANPDWLHFNGFDYNEELDQIVISCHAFDELWIISHAPGDNADLLYRWGNPQAYGMGTPADQQFFNQHNAQWIDDGLPGAGNLMVFNNGNGRPAGAYSSADEIVPPLNPDGSYARDPGSPYGPAAPVWTCDTIGGSSFYSSFISGVQRLPNDNTLICVGASGEFHEVSTDCALQWSSTPGSTQFRATRIGARDTRLRDLLWCSADLATPYGTLNVDDVDAFVSAFLAGDNIADCDGSGVLNVDDIDCFVASFLGGCP